MTPKQLAFAQRSELPKDAHAGDCPLWGDRLIPCTCGVSRLGLEEPSPAPAPPAPPPSPPTAPPETPEDRGVSDAAADAAAVAAPEEEPITRLELLDALSQAERERDAARTYNKKLASEKKALAKENVALMERVRELEARVGELEPVERIVKED